MDITISFFFTASLNIGPFNIKITDQTNTTRTYATGVSRASIVAGYVVQGITTSDVLIIAESTGTCGTSASVDITTVTGAGSASYTLTSAFSAVGTTESCTSVGSFRPYLNSSDYTKYVNAGYCFANVNATTSDLVIYTKSGGFYPAPVNFVDDCGKTWTVESNGTLTYRAVQC